MQGTIEQEQELKQEALTVTQKAALVRITDQPSYNQATVLLLETIIPFRKRWAEYWNPLKKAAHDENARRFVEMIQATEHAAQGRAAEC